MAADATEDIAKQFEKWCRLVIFIEEGGKAVCKNILHTRLGVPKEGSKLYEYLQHYKTEIKRCELQPFQENILLPSDGVIENSKLDLLLYTYIVQILDKVKEYPFIKELRYKRNELFHMEGARRDMSEQNFEEHWNQVSYYLLKCHFDGMELMSSLKTDALFLSQEHLDTLKDILYNIQGNNLV